MRMGASCLVAECCCVGAAAIVAVAGRWFISGDEAVSTFSTSSSLSVFCETASRPSRRSVAHFRICHPSPSLRPMCRLSRKDRRSSRQSWYPSDRALDWAAADVLYSLVTDNAAALKESSSCSGESAWTGPLVGEAPLMFSI